MSTSPEAKADKQMIDMAKLQMQVDNLQADKERLIEALKKAKQERNSKNEQIAQLSGENGKLTVKVNIQAQEIEELKTEEDEFGTLEPTDAC